MSHNRNDAFLDEQSQSARASAQPLIGFLFAQLRPASVLDVGSGRGIWLNEWRRKGVETVLGVDGDHLDRANLAISSEDFMVADLIQPLNVGRRFDLAQCLEVGERLPQDTSVTLVGSLTAASDRVLFCAAVKGQGGAANVNEQPLAFWQDRFEARGYRAFDCVRPVVRHNRDVAAWFRFNSVLYVNEMGRAGLPEAIRQCEVPEVTRLQDGGDVAWRLRRHVVSCLPRAAVTKFSRMRSALSPQRGPNKSDGPRLAR